MRLTAADALLGFQKVIDATFFFRKAIDKARLEASLQALLAVQPMLGSTVRRRGPALHPLEGWEVVSGASEPSLLIEQRSASGTSCKAALEPDPGARFVPVFDGEAVMRGSRQCRRAAAPCRRSRLRHPSRAAAELLGSTTEIKPGVSFLSTVRARTKA